MDFWFEIFLNVYSNALLWLGSAKNKQRDVALTGSTVGNTILLGAVYMRSGTGYRTERDNFYPILMEKNRETIFGSVIIKI